MGLAWVTAGYRPFGVKISVETGKCQVLTVAAERHFRKASARDGDRSKCTKCQAGETGDRSTRYHWYQLIHILHIVSNYHEQESEHHPSMWRWFKLEMHATWLQFLVVEVLESTSFYILVLFKSSCQSSFGFARPSTDDDDDVNCNQQ